MKLNTVLLTSAATLMATSVAFAADLPSKKAAPSAGSVQVCKIAGKTGFTLPGSGTCVVLSGYVWAEVNATGSGTGVYDTTDIEDNYSTKLREQINIDALTNTEMGVLASHLSYRWNQYGQSAGSDDYAALDSAYIQLGGLKVGKFSSTFGMMDGSPSYEAPNNSPSNSVMQIGYSAKLGNGVTLGLALEDVVSSYSYGPDQGYIGYAEMPDVVATLDFSMGMADIHLGGAFHDISAEGSSDTYGGSGYAFDAGVNFKLDSIAKGDTFGIEYTYTDGASARLSGHGVPGDAYLDLYGGQYGGFTSDQFHSDSNKVTSYNIGAAFHHVFSSNLSGNIFGGYQVITMDSGGNDYSSEFKSSFIGANLDYQPAKGFHIQPEVYHVSHDATYSEDSYVNNGSYTGAVLRIKRDF